MSKIRRMQRMKDQELTNALDYLKGVQGRYFDQLQYYHNQGVKNTRFVFNNAKQDWLRQVAFINSKNKLSTISKSGFERRVWGMIKQVKKDKTSDPTSKLLIKCVKQSTGRLWLIKMWLDDIKRK